MNPALSPTELPCHSVILDYVMCCKSKTSFLWIRINQST